MALIESHEYSAGEGCFVITFDRDVITIGNDAFVDCETVTRIELPTSLTDIGEYAFTESCLREITLPASVEYVNTFAFNQCDILSIKMSKNTRYEQPYLSNARIIRY